MKTPIEARDKHAVVNGLRFHYREWGDTAAPPLLVLHGLTGHAWEFDAIGAGLADRLHVLALNQRGHGATSWAEEYSPDVMAGDIAAFMGALGLERARIIGHSMGGVNAWWLAARYPERVDRLVIIDVTPETIAAEDPVRVWIDALSVSDRSRNAAQDEAVARFLAENPGPHQEQLRVFVLNNLEAGGDGRWRWRFDSRGLVRWLEQASADEKTHWSLLRRLGCPTLVVRAGNSPFTDSSAVRRMAREIPQADLVEIPDSGHDIHIDRLPALLAELRGFLIR